VLAFPGGAEVLASPGGAEVLASHEMMISTACFSMDLNSLLPIIPSRK